MRTQVTRMFVAVYELDQVPLSWRAAPRYVVDLTTQAIIPTHFGNATGGRPVVAAESALLGG